MANVSHGSEGGGDGASYACEYRGGASIARGGCVSYLLGLCASLHGGGGEIGGGGVGLYVCERCSS